MTDGIADRYTVCAADDVVGELAKKNYAAIISIEHPGAKDGAGRAPRLAEQGIKTRQYIFTFWDHFIEGAPGMFSPRLAQKSLALLRRFRGQPILIHCKAGKARSAGIAVLGLADELGPGREAEVAELLETIIRPISTPNPLVVQTTDRLLERDGALMQAIYSHPGIKARMPEYFAAIEHSAAKLGNHDPRKP